MTLKRRSAGAWTSIATTIKRKAAGSWVNVGTIKRRLSGAWVTIWSAAAITDSTVSRSSRINTTANYTIKSDGTVTKTEGASTTTLETWLVVGSAGDYEVRATLSSGDTPSGTLGTWLALSSNRPWELVAGPSETLTCVLAVDIRIAASGAVCDSAAVTISSTNTA